MLGNDYANLYECDFYKTQVNIYKTKNTDMYSNFEAQFALANVLYTESKKYYKYVDNQLIISGNSEFISIILSKYPRVLDILKHASSMDEIFNSSKDKTALQAAIEVCNIYFENDKEKVKKL